MVMSNFLIQPQNGILLLNNSPISIFDECQFINDTKNIEINSMDYNGFLTYCFPLSLEEFLFQFSITFFQSKNIKKAFHLTWINCKTQNDGYNADQSTIIQDINKLQIFMSEYLNCTFEKVNKHIFECLTDWGTVRIGGSLKIPSVGVSFIHK